MQMEIVGPVIQATIKMAQSVVVFLQMLLHPTIAIVGIATVVTRKKMTIVASVILRKLGWKVAVAINGQEAVDMLTSHPYDLVFMDIQMPVMDGFTATGVIRDTQSSVQNHNTPVVAMTAHNMIGDREKCLRAGMNDYISKPVSSASLAEILNRWIPNNNAVVQQGSESHDQNKSIINEHSSFLFCSMDITTKCNGCKTTQSSV